MSSSSDSSVGFVNLFVVSAAFLIGFLGGAKFYQLTSNLEELEKNHTKNVLNLYQEIKIVKLHQFNMK